MPEVSWQGSRPPGLTVTFRYDRARTARCNHDSRWNGHQLRVRRVHPGPADGRQLTVNLLVTRARGSMNDFMPGPTQTGPRTFRHGRPRLDSRAHRQRGHAADPIHLRPVREYHQQRAGRARIPSSTPAGRMTAPVSTTTGPSILPNPACTDLSARIEPPEPAPTRTPTSRKSSARRHRSPSGLLTIVISGQFGIQWTGRGECLQWSINQGLNNLVAGLRDREPLEILNSGQVQLAIDLDPPRRRPRVILCTSSGIAWEAARALTRPWGSRIRRPISTRSDPFLPNQSIPDNIPTTNFLQRDTLPFGSYLPGPERRERFDRRPQVAWALHHHRAGTRR